MRAHRQSVPVSASNVKHYLYIKCNRKPTSRVFLKEITSLKIKVLLAFTRSLCHYGHFGADIFRHAPRWVTGEGREDFE